jgi:telomerase reverse transcriptase
MLCNIYFGNIEEILLDGVFEIGSSRIIRGCSSTDCDAVLVQDKSDIHLLVRIVDDFLLISTNKSTSARFMKKLNEGIPSLGVAINGDKSRVNYPLSLANTTTGKLGMVTACHDLFPWCGLLIDTRTCEISLDYKRFCGSHSTDTVVIHRGGNEGLHLKKKLKDFVRPRCCQRLLFSSDVNRIDMIRLNFYQTFLLCAVKLVHYITSGSRETSAQFIYDAACDTIHFAFALISSKIQHGNWRASSSTNKRSLAFQLSWKDALWLGRHAFRHVLRRQWSRKMRGRSESYIMDTQKVLLLLFSDSHRSLDAEGTPSTSAFEKDLLAVTRRARQFPLNA